MNMQLQNALRIITPFRTLTTKEKSIVPIAALTMVSLAWISSTSHYIPHPKALGEAFVKLIWGRDMFRELMKSLMFCLKSTGYAVLIALIFCFASVIPVLKPICVFARKFRFLPSTGLSFLFMQLTADSGGIQAQASWMMIFGVTTFLIDSLVGIALSINNDDISYCKSLKLNRWQMFRETLLLGKAPELYQAVVQQFAMSWMLIAAIENIVRADGGIGVILNDSSKRFKIEQVYAIQLCILLTGTTVDYIMSRLKYRLFPQLKLKAIKQ